MYVHGFRTQVVAEVSVHHHREMSISISKLAVVCELWCHPDRFFCLFRPAYAAVSASLAVDLYPLALHVSLCDPAGRPGGRERLVLTSHHVHVRDMLADVLDSSRVQRMNQGMSMTAATSPQEVGLVCFSSLFVKDVFGCMAHSFPFVFPRQLRRLCAILSPFKRSIPCRRLESSRLEGVGMNELLRVFAYCACQDPVLESADVVQEQRLSEEGDVVGNEETPLRRDVSNRNRTGHVRLWVLEISTSGLIDTPHVHAVSVGDKSLILLIC